jgi:hypothetical protein
MVHVHRSGGPPILTAAKICLLLLTGALLPACNSDARDDVLVTVENTGSEAVRVRVEARQPGHDEVDEAIVAAGNSALFGYDNVERIEVVITRTSDNSVIFLDSWNRDDLRRIGDVVSITVSP